MPEIYHASSDATPEVLTISAFGMEHASIIYYLWCKHHRPEASVKGVKLLLAPDEYVQRQPNLAEMLQADRTGVGNWLAHLELWELKEPHQDQVGLLERPTPVMAFAFSDDDDAPILVFATHLNEALAIYDRWHRDAWGCAAEWDCLRPVSRDAFVGPQMSLIADMDAGVTGVGGECEDGAWRIRVPE